MNNLGFNNKAWGSPATTDMLNRNTLQPPPLMSQNTGLGNLGRNIVTPFQQPQQVFQNTMGLQQQNIAGLGRGLTLANSAMNPSLNQQIGSNALFQQVTYPNTRNLNANVSPGLNPAAFKATVQQTVQNTGAGAKQRVFTGKVTQIHENFGLVDEEVVFQMSACVKGSNPVVGDRVLVEASYTPNMHFKWSATRIQVLSVNAVSPTSGQTTSAVSGYNGSSSGYNAVPPPPPPPPPEASAFGRGGDNGSGGGYSRQENFGGRGGDAYGRDNVSFVRPENFSRSDTGGFGRSDNANFGRSDNFGRGARQKATAGRGRERSREKDKDDDEVERKRRREERLREREKEEKKASPVRKRSRSPKTRRRSRVVPRYMVQIPKIALDLPNADVLELRRRYSNLYVPSDFFFTNIKWVDSFPPDKPFALNKSCSFHVMGKDIEPVTENTAVLEPSDADYSFSAKVMLMSVPGMEELYQKCCGILEEKDKRERDRDSEERDYIHPTRLVNFLVGLRGKNETMAIGGPWSPSLDGANPDKDPTVLIKTAIRTCKALTGIDLSNCTQWYRFVELYYRRGGGGSSGGEHKGKSSSARVETVVVFLPDVWSCLPTRLEWDSLQASYRRRWEGLNGAAGDDAASDGAKKEEKDDNLSGGEETDEKKKAELVHFSQLDPKTMSVNDLRAQLKSRGAPHKGLKSQLVARLTKLLKLEEQTEALKNEDSGNENDEGEDETEILLRSVKAGVQDDKEKDKKSDKSEAEIKKLDERERALLEKRYALPDQQHIIVHPSKTAKSGKFDCTVMSLSLLLDYRPEDTKEHSFEVSLFAELFNEMLIRDFGFNIYKALTVLPDKPKEDKDKKDDKKEKDSKKDKDEKKDDKKDEKKDDDKKKDTEKKRSSDSKDKSENKDDKKDSRKDDQESSDDNDDDNEEKDKKREKEKDKKKRVKLVTKDKQLLLSFIYFDQSHCGYIFDKDIEELLYTLGVQLSRAQVKKLVSKVVTRDSLHYRKLTDAPKDEEVITMVTEVDLHELAMGNRSLLPVFKDKESTKKRSTAFEQEQNEQDGRFVMFNGSLVDVGKLMAQLERSEKARLDTETRMVDLKNDNQKLQDKYNKSSSTVKHLNSELKEYKDKVRNTEDTLSKISSNSKIFYTTLVEIRDKIEPVLRSSSSKEEILKREKDEKDKRHDEAKSRWEKERDSKEAMIKKESDTKETTTAVEMKADNGTKKDN